MSAKIWMKWLSVIALILVIIDMFSQGSGIIFSITTLNVSVLVLSVAAIIASFSKPKK